MRTFLRRPTESDFTDKAPKQGHESPSLIGKWEAVTEHILENGEWVLNFIFPSGTAWCEFRGNGHMTESYGGEKLRGTYCYDPGNRKLLANDVISHVVSLTETELVIRQTAEDIVPLTYKTTYRRI